MTDLDETDRQIIAHLAADARLPVAKLAQKLGLARTTVQARLDHELKLAAYNYTPTDDTLIPTGQIAAVKGTPLDFTTTKRVGRDISELVDTAWLGYDHNFILKEKPSAAPEFAARLTDPGSGRVMEVWTTEPGVQLYSGNFLFGQQGKGGKVYEKRGALCLECQHFPDSVNHPDFPTTILQPGETYRQTTVHKFLAQ